jgi:hypothetical protein
MSKLYVHTVVLSCGSDKVFLLKSVMVLALILFRLLFLKVFYQNCAVCFLLYGQMALRRPWLYRQFKGGAAMDISTLQRLDANILLGIINEKLRLECDGLEELLAYYDMSEAQLAGRLDQIGYHYDPVSNQFKAHL